MLYTLPPVLNTSNLNTNPFFIPAPNDDYATNINTSIIYEMNYSE